MNRELQVERGRRFRRLHESGTFLMPNAWNAGSALLLETAGFEAVGTNSAGIAYSLGKADATGALSIDEALDETARIAGAISIPVNVDAENGYGDSPEAVAECIRRCIDAGAVGAGIEDYTWDPRAPALRPRPGGRTQFAPPGRPWTRRAYRSCSPHGRSATSTACPMPSPNPSPGRTSTREAGADLLYTPGVRDRGEIAALVRAKSTGPMNFVVGKGTADYTAGGARRPRDPKGEHRGVADARDIRARRARRGGDEGAGPLHLGRGSARSGGLRPAVRHSPRRVNRPREQGV